MKSIIHNAQTGRCCPALEHRRGSRALRVAVRAEAKGNDFFSGVKAVAKKVQGALPIVGLVSRWAAPEGGFDELAYPEYSRAMIDKAPVSYRIAQTDLERMYGKPANSRWVLLILWMSKTGVGLVPSKEIISAARRLRITQDIEIEVDRFELSRANVVKKYDLMQVPQGKLVDKLAVAVDALCVLCIGLKDGEAVPAQAVPLLRDLVKGAFEEADEAMVDAAIAERPSRA